MSSDNQSLNSGARQFATTHWSVVLTACHHHDTRGQEALEKLCRAYWYPLYAFIRHQGYGLEAAQDITQDFFARLLQKNALSFVDPDKGRFRSFLLGSLKHFLANYRDQVNAQKRGGGQLIFSIDAHSAETRYYPEPSVETTPDKVYEKQWALTLLERVMARLREEHAAAGKLDQFDLFKDCLQGDKTAITYAEISERLGIGLSAVKMTVSRLRQRYRELVFAEIAETVASPADIEDEIRYLLAALSN